jgi:hypothetical protein
MCSRLSTVIHRPWRTVHALESFVSVAALASLSLSERRSASLASNQGLAFAVYGSGQLRMSI